MMFKKKLIPNNLFKKTFSKYQFSSLYSASDLSLFNSSSIHHQNHHFNSPIQNHQNLNQIKVNEEKGFKKKKLWFLKKKKKS